jgi:hypothetical protein
MYKYVIAVAFLSYVALGDNISPFNRQAIVSVSSSWTGEEFCTETCREYCENCTEPVRCNEDQKKCGEKPIDVDMKECSPDDICVPKDCECDYEDANGDSCERICTVDCTEEQIKCEVKQTETGCFQNDICIHKGFSNDGIQLCDGFCPVECEDTELFCPNENLPNGCKQAEDCIPKQRDHDSKICPQQQCPLECKETRHLCVGSVDDYGCKEDDVCVLKQTSDTGELCPGTCPVTCTDGEILCNGQIDWSDTEQKGCVGQDICHVKAKSDTLVFCPPDSASHECPKTCPPIEVLCEPYEGPTGCKGPYTCETRSVDNMDQYCPSTADCPVYCKPDEYNCPTGVDENDCKLPDQCIKKERGIDGELCPFHCPELCSEEQVFCEGGITETGCKGPSSCRDKEEHRWGPGADTEPKEECPGFCPTVCESHEILCPSQLDPCNGCPTEQVCREAIKDNSGSYCPGKEIAGQDTQDTSLRKGQYLSFSHNCPKLCRELEGEVLCPTYEDEVTGCKPEAECVMRVKDDNDDWCPYHSVCGKQCPKEYQLCESDIVDENGCKGEQTCVYKGRDNNQLLCPGQCPPTCSNGDELVSPGFNTNGCPIPSICQEAA